MQASNVPNAPVRATRTTADIIASIESSNADWAIRFERRAFAAITNKGGNDTTAKIQRVHHCSADTARMLYATSFGRYQIMGFNLWGILRYSMTYAEFIADPDAQADAFNAFLIVKGIQYSPADLMDAVKRRNFALRYNGSAKYADRILAELK